MKFFDLHLHPGLKTLFLEQTGEQISAWTDLNPKDTLFGNILESQSSYKMLTVKGNINLICLTLHPPEMGMLNQIILKIGSKIFFSKFISPSRLKEMYTGECSYQEVFTSELKNTQLAPKPEDNIPTGTRLLFLKNWSDYNPDDQKTLHVILNIEGGHTFYGTENRFEGINESLALFNKFINQGFLTFYLTPTHLTPNVFITHAYGNKILTKAMLLPKGIGITSHGKDLIVAAYARNVLIDIKHMSLVSRRMFYEIRKRHFPQMPIIASHMGLNGISWVEFLTEFKPKKPRNSAIKGELKKNKGAIEGTYFYPLSINLFSEDVAEILKSDGLIGISLDVRILGGKDNFSKPQFDFLTKEELSFLQSATNDDDLKAKINQRVDMLYADGIPVPSVSLADLDGEDMEDLMDVEEEADELLISSTREDIKDRKNFNSHIRLIANHMIRIHQISSWYGLSHPWDNICIGSDFDGLVQAVDCCKNCTEFDALVEPLKNELNKASEILNLDLVLPAENIVENFCYKNAIRILERHFTV